MGNHIKKLERLKNLQKKEEYEFRIQEAYRKSERIKHSFVALIRDAQVKELRNEYPNKPCFQVLVSFLVQNESITKQKVLNQWFDNLALMAENLEDKCPKWFKEADYVKALIEVAKYRSAWVRPIEDWKPKAKSDYERFKELTNYLFVLYETPRFLQHIFFHQQDHYFIQDYIYLAQGYSVKSICSRIPLNNKMKTEFMKSPDGFRVFEAFRYTQVIGLGGDHELAYRLAYSWLGRQEMRNEVLWETFIRILIAGGMFNHDKISELIDYVQYETNVNLAYSLKGRTLASLIRQSDEWHEQFSQDRKKQGLIIWKSATFKPFELTEGKGENSNTYRMVELLSNKELIDEGQKMHHCVGSYSYHCERGRTRIVSLRRFQFEWETERMATIEVDLINKRIVQAKYRYNKAISEKALSFLYQWANLNGFSMGKYL